MINCQRKFLATNTLNNLTFFLVGLLQAANALGNTDLTQSLVHNTSIAPRILQPRSVTPNGRPGVPHNDVPEEDAKLNNNRRKGGGRGGQKGSLPTGDTKVRGGEGEEGGGDEVGDNDERKRRKILVYKLFEQPDKILYTVVPCSKPKSNITQPNKLQHHEYHHNHHHHHHPHHHRHHHHRHPTIIIIIIIIFIFNFKIILVYGRHGQGRKRCLRKLVLLPFGS